MVMSFRDNILEKSQRPILSTFIGRGYLRARSSKFEESELEKNKAGTSTSSNTSLETDMALTKRSRTYRVRLGFQLVKFESRWYECRLNERLSFRLEVRRFRFRRIPFYFYFLRQPLEEFANFHFCRRDGIAQRKHSRFTQPSRVRFLAPVSERSAKKYREKRQ